MKVQLFTTELQNHLDYSSLTIFFFFLSFLTFQFHFKDLPEVQVETSGQGWQRVENPLKWLCDIVMKL